MSGACAPCVSVQLAVGVRVYWSIFCFLIIVIKYLIVKTHFAKWNEEMSKRNFFFFFFFLENPEEMGVSPVTWKETCHELVQDLLGNLLASGLKCWIMLTKYEIQVNPGDEICYTSFNQAVTVSDSIVQCMHDHLDKESWTWASMLCFSVWETFHHLAVTTSLCSAWATLMSYIFCNSNWGVATHLR